VKICENNETAEAHITIVDVNRLANNSSSKKFLK
jgi:hypothetical protein